MDYIVINNGKCINTKVYATHLDAIRDAEKFCLDNPGISIFVVKVVSSHIGSVSVKSQVYE